MQQTLKRDGIAEQPKQEPINRAHAILSLYLFEARNIRLRERPAYLASPTKLSSETVLEERIGVDKLRWLKRICADSGLEIYHFPTTNFILA